MNKLKLFATFLIGLVAGLLALVCHAPFTAAFFVLTALLVVHKPESLNRRLRAFGVCLALIFVALAILPIKAQVRNRGATLSVGDLTAVSINVFPEDNATNVATFYDNTQTNFTRFNPTNAGFWVRQQGSNSFAAGVATMNTGTGLTNNTTGKVLVFINGLFVGTQ